MTTEKIQELAQIAKKMEATPKINMPEFPWLDNVTGQNIMGIDYRDILSWTERDKKLREEVELLNWLESVKGQVWHGERGWTCFVRKDKRYAIQPTKPTLREVIQEAKQKYESDTGKNN